jgi:hypothetical protein
MSRRQGNKRTWLGRNGITVVLACAGAAGFAIGLLYHPHDGNVQATVPVNKTVRLASHSFVSGTMDNGWKRPEAWGTWMKGPAASIFLGFDGAASGDVELLLEARTRSKKGKRPQTLSIRFNGSEIGQWRLPRKTRKLRRRYIIPRSVFNRSTVGQLTFKSINGKRPSAQFGLEAVALRDARRLLNFKGHVDVCHTKRIVGWAVASDSAVNVTATVNGKPLQATFVNIDRPDLGRHGLPVAAGFKLIPHKPISVGSTIDVQFANGRSLIGSPCQAN